MRRGGGCLESLFWVFIYILLFPFLILSDLLKNMNL